MSTLREQIMEMKGIARSNERYDELWAALKVTLIQRDHREVAWADLGIKEYYYAHEQAAKVRNVTTTSTTNSAEASGKDANSLAGLESAASSSSLSVPFTINEELVNAKTEMKVLKSASKTLLKIQSEVKKAVSDMKVQQLNGQLSKEACDDLENLIAARVEIQSALDEISLMEARFDDVSKGDVHALEKLSADMVDLKNICLARSSGWKKRKANQTLAALAKVAASAAPGTPPPGQASPSCHIED